MHDDAAAYALDALEDEERVRFEEHLRTCAACAEQVAWLRATASGLAFSTGAAAPPAELRSRLLEAALAGRENVVPLRPRREWGRRLLPAAATAATAAAVGLGVWVSSLDRSLARERAALAVLGDPAARRLPVHGARGSLVVAPSGQAALAVGLPRPPSGKRYEVWVMSPRARPAGLFSTRATKLNLPVHRGDIVAVTLERAGGVDAPTSKPLLTVRV